MISNIRVNKSPVSSRNVNQMEDVSQSRAELKKKGSYLRRDD